MKTTNNQNNVDDPAKIGKALWLGPMSLSAVVLSFLFLDSGGPFQWTFAVLPVSHRIWKTPCSSLKTIRTTRIWSTMLGEVFQNVKGLSGATMIVDEPRLVSQGSDIRSKLGNPNHEETHHF